MLGNRGLAVVLLAGAAAAGSAPVQAQGVPGSVGELISVCKPIISEQYGDDDSRWGQCIAATEAYLNALIPTLPTVEDKQEAVAVTVDELVKLYQPQDCRYANTELPIAIGTAKSYTQDGVQLAAIDDIVDAIGGCQQVATAAIPVEQNVVSPAQL